MYKLGLKWEVELIINMFLRALAKALFGGLSHHMSTSGSLSSELKKKRYRIPILWKRKVNALIKEDPQTAIRTFFENYKLGKDQNKMRYGLVVLIPESLIYIVESFDNLSPEELTVFVDLLASPDFENALESLENDHQKGILAQIQNKWESGLLNRDSVYKILLKLDKTFVDSLYRNLIKNDSKTAFEILKLWGIDTYPQVLSSYLETPHELVESIFKELSPNLRVEIVETVNKKFITSRISFQNLLHLLTPSEEEISFLLSFQPKLENNSRETLNSWLLNQKFPLKFIIEAYKKSTSEKNHEFIVQFFVGLLEKKSYQPEYLMGELISLREFQISHDLLGELDKKTNEQVKILLSTLNSFQDKVFPYLDFYKEEFQTYGTQEITLTTQTYLKSPYDSVHQILLPTLQNSASKKWKEILKTANEILPTPPSHLVSNIFINCTKRIKGKIGEFIISQSWLSQLENLYNDFFIFQSVLIRKKTLSTSNQVILEPYLKRHVSTNFKEIILLGEKITFPKLAFASIMTKESLTLLLETIIESRKSINLLEYWEELFFTSSKDALQIILNRVSKNDSKKNELIPIGKKLVKLELETFWEYFSEVPIKRIPYLDEILEYAFKISIPNLNTLLIEQPDSHLNYINEKIIPNHLTEGSRIIYSLLSLQESTKYDEVLINKIVLSLIQQDQENLLSPTLHRCSKLIQSSHFSPLSSGLFSNLLSKYPETLTIIEVNKLESLVPTITKFLASTPSKKRVKILLNTLPRLSSQILAPLIIDEFIRQIQTRNNYTTLELILDNYEKTSYSAQGESTLIELIIQLVGRSPESDLSLFKVISGKTKSEKRLLSDYFSQISETTLERIFYDPTLAITPLMINSIIKRFEENPPINAEDYFFSLLRKAKKDNLKKAIIPLIGNYCSWKNLSQLIELKERSKYTKAYEQALANFAQRYNIESSRALLEIWKSGLKEIYGQKQTSASWQSYCPQCDHPILEDQKNCGFCTQRLTCVICFKSVVKPRGNIVRCPQCNNFFHRAHLLESVKHQNRCPVCNINLTEEQVVSLDNFDFQFY